MYDFNPIVNYFYYNKGTESKTIDQRLNELDDYRQEMFVKHKLRLCTVNMQNCFAMSPYSQIDLHKTIKLTPEFLNHLGFPGLLEASSTDSRVGKVQFNSLEATKKNKKPAKQQTKK